MKFYYLDTKFTSGQYKGKTLEEVFEKDPEYVDNCLKEDDNFLLTEEVIGELQTANPDHVFSTESITRRKEKEEEYDADNEADADDLDFDEDDFDADDFEDFDEENFEEEDVDDLYEDDLDKEEEEEDDIEDYDDSQEDSRWDRF